jgi:hypothetical protein
LFSWLVLLTIEFDYLATTFIVTFDYGQLVYSSAHRYVHFVLCNYSYILLTRSNVLRCVRESDYTIHAGKEGTICFDSMTPMFRIFVPSSLVYVSTTIIRMILTYLPEFLRVFRSFVCLFRARMRSCVLVRARTQMITIARRPCRLLTSTGGSRECYLYGHMAYGARRLKCTQVRL